MNTVRSNELLDVLRKAKQEVVKNSGEVVLFNPRIASVRLFSGMLRVSLILTDPVYPRPRAELKVTELDDYGRFTLDILVSDLRSEEDVITVAQALQDALDISQSTVLRQLRSQSERTDEKWKRDFFVLTADGLPFWFPYIEPREDDATYALLQSNPLEQTLVYNASTGRRRTVHIPCTSNPHPAALRAFLDDPPFDLLVKKTKNLVNEKNWGNVETVTAKAEVALDTHSVPPTAALYALGCAWLWDHSDEIPQEDPEPPEALPPIPDVFVEDLKLLPHQDELIRRLLADSSALVSLDMGGGKTVVSLVDTVYHLAGHAARRACIVAPNSLIEQFEGEIERFTQGNVGVVVITSATVKEKGLDRLKKEIDEAYKENPLTIILTTYHAVQSQRLGEWLINDAGVDMVTLDEAHTIKNPGSEFQKATFPLAHARVRRVMSGTFLSNTAEDLLIPFGMTRPNVLLGFWGKIRKAKYELSTEEVLELRERVKQEKGVMIYDRAAWISQMPPRKLYVHTVTPDDETGQKIKELIHQSNQRPKETKVARTAEAILPMRQDLDVVLAPVKGEKVREITTGDSSKTLVLCLWKESASIVAEHAAGTVYWAGLDRALQSFMRGKTKVLVGVDRSLKYGLNLQSARRVVRVEPNYTWADEDQSFSRVFRWGQKQPVELHFIFANRSHDVIIAHNLAVKIATSALFSKPWYTPPKELRGLRLRAYRKVDLMEALKSDVDVRLFRKAVEDVWTKELEAQKHYARFVDKEPVPLPRGATPTFTGTTITIPEPKFKERRFDVNVPPPPPPPQPPKRKPKLSLKTVMRKTVKTVALNPVFDRLYYFEWQEKKKVQGSSLLEKLSRGLREAEDPLNAFVLIAKNEHVERVFAKLVKKDLGVARVAKAAETFKLKFPKTEHTKFKANIPFFWGARDEELHTLVLIYVADIFDRWIKQHAQEVHTALIEVGFEKRVLTVARRVNSEVLQALPDTLRKIALKLKAKAGDVKL